MVSASMVTCLQNFSMKIWARLVVSASFMTPYFLKSATDSRLLSTGRASRDGAAGPAGLQLLHDVGEHLPQEDGDDGGRGLVGAEAVVVGGGGDGGAEQVGVQVHGADDGAQEDQELRVRVGLVARVEQ